jgi:hypothetical protein
MNRCVCLVFALALVAVPALANIPAPDLCVLSNPAGTDGAVVFSRPDGGGAAFNEARLGGVLVDATLTLTVVNSSGNPIAGYPAEDIYITSTNAGTALVVCADLQPDGATDANGQTQWVNPVAAGGNTLGEELQAIIGADAVPTTAAVQIVSADITGDLQVNLSDVTIFAQGVSTYNPAADFNGDGNVNLTDVALIAQAVGAVCP